MRERERERERKLTTISLKRLASFGGRKAPILAVAETKNESMCFGGNEEERERVQLCLYMVLFFFFLGKWDIDV